LLSGNRPSYFAPYYLARLSFDFPLLSLCCTADLDRPPERQFQN